MWAKVNLFAAWFLIAQLLLRNIITGIGTWLLGVSGMPVPLNEQFGWLAGALLVAFALLILRKVMGELPPGIGKPGVNGYRLGHWLLLASNALALGAYGLPFAIQSLQEGVPKVILSMFVLDAGYLAIALFAIGVSLIYQSTLPPAAKAKSVGSDPIE